MEQIPRALLKERESMRLRGFGTLPVDHLPQRGHRGSCGTRVQQGHADLRILHLKGGFRVQVSRVGGGKTALSPTLPTNISLSWMQGTTAQSPGALKAQSTKKGTDTVDDISIFVILKCTHSPTNCSVFTYPAF